MKAFVVDKYKKKGALRLADVPEPKLLDDDMLVQVHAAGVNLLDNKIRDGEFKLFLPYRPPFLLGHDVAGTVVKVGPQVKRFKVGDEIYARPRDHRIGTFAIQLAKHLGSTVATTTSAKNIELVKSLGADVVIEYTKQDFEKVLSDYDLVLNSQDSKTLNKSLSVLKQGGKIISISGPPDLAFAKELGLNLILKLVMRFLSRSVRKKAKSLGVKYSFLFMRAEGQQLSEITSLFESGVVRPVVDKVFPFEKTNDALAYVEAGRAKGKVVIAIKYQG